MIIAYFTACDDGTYHRAELDTATMIETIEEISADEYLDAMNEYEGIEDWT